MSAGNEYDFYMYQGHSFYLHLCLQGVQVERKKREMCSQGWKEVLPLQYQLPEKDQSVVKIMIMSMIIIKTEY